MTSRTGVDGASNTHLARCRPLPFYGDRGNLVPPLELVGHVAERLASVQRPGNLALATLPGPRRVARAAILDPVVVAGPNLVWPESSIHTPAAPVPIPSGHETGGASIGTGLWGVMAHERHSSAIALFSSFPSTNLA